MFTQDEDWVDTWGTSAMGVSLHDMSLSVFKYIGVQVCAHLCGGKRTISSVTTQDTFYLGFLCLFVLVFMRQNLYSHCWPGTL